LPLLSFLAGAGVAGAAIAGAVPGAAPLTRCAARAKAIWGRLTCINGRAVREAGRLWKELEASGFDPLQISDPIVSARFEQEAAAWKASAPDLPKDVDDWTPEHTQSAGEHAAAFLAICDRLGFRKVPTEVGA
jgi:hypothetical protein